MSKDLSRLSDEALDKRIRSQSDKAARLGHKVFVSLFDTTEHENLPHDDFDSLQEGDLIAFYEDRDERSYRLPWRLRNTSVSEFVGRTHYLAVVIKRTPKRIKTMPVRTPGGLFADLGPMYEDEKYADTMGDSGYRYFIRLGTYEDVLAAFAAAPGYQQWRTAHDAAMAANAEQDRRADAAQDRQDAKEQVLKPQVDLLNEVLGAEYFEVETSSHMGSDEAWIGRTGYTNDWQYYAPKSVFVAMVKALRFDGDLNQALFLKAIEVLASDDVK